MERGERLARMGLQIPAAAQVRVVLCSDVKNEADDAFAVVHHLLTPSFDVRGIIALHFESKSPGSLTTMERSYRGLLELLRITGMEEVPALRGCREPLEHEKDAPESEGVRFLIAEALRPDPRPLYVTVLGALTDVAAAINRCPEIAGRMTVVWIGGGPYPHGMREFNLMQDLPAARAVFVSPVAMWQVPLNVYASMEVTLAELASRVRPCGRPGGISTGSWRTMLGRTSAPGTGCTGEKTGAWETSPRWGCCSSAPCGATGRNARRPASATI